MRGLGLLLGMVICSFSANAAEGRGVHFFLKNGDHIKGRLHGFSMKDGYTWSNPALRGMLRLEAVAVQRMQLEPAEAPRDGARVRLVNGDEITGDITGLDGQSLTLDRTCAGRLVIPRAQIRWLVPRPGKVVFNGPKSLKDWGMAYLGVRLTPNAGAEGVSILEVVAGTAAAKAGLKAGDIITRLDGKVFKDEGFGRVTNMIAYVKSRKIGDPLQVTLSRGQKTLKIKATLGSANWKFDKGAFIGWVNPLSPTYMIGRELKWPAVASVDFDLEWDADLGMEIHLCADRMGTDRGMNAYALRLFQGNSVLTRHTGAGAGFGQIQQLGQAGLGWDARKRRARVSIRVDRRNKIIALLVDGRLVKKWIDKGSFAGKGNVLQFKPLAASRMVIRNLRLREWNGCLQQENPAVAKGADLVQLLNNDNLPGQVLAMAKGKLRVKTGFGEVDVPLPRVANIVFGQKPAAKKQPRTGNRAIFHLGQSGQLEARLLSWTADAVQVESPRLGKLKITPAAVSAVEFK